MISGDVDKQAIANPQTHYGSGKAATRNFFVQRLTGALNVLLTLFLVWFVVQLAGAERAEMAAVVRNPLVAFGLAVLLISVAVHMRIGMREIIEDYVHDPKLNRFSLMLNSFFALCIALLGIGSVAKILFWG